MKNNIIKICITFIFLLLIVNCKAQNTFPKEGDNILNNDINKFAGTWKWEGNGQIFKIILKKENVKIPVNFNLHGDVLYGWHEYIINGSTIESNMQNINTPFSNKSYSLFAMGSKDNSNQLSLGITHLSKNKSVNAIIDYIDATHIKLVSLKNPEGLRLNYPGEPPFDPSITLPQNIILTKQ